MIRDQFTLDVHPELIIDNFAGGGGASTGIEMALGRCVDIAINHDPEAVLMHEINHPQTQHYCESVWDVDPREVTSGRPVGLAWFSPDCKHFSKAKGGKPRDKGIRGLAWIVLRYAALVRPRVIMLENVEEFKTWGPLLADGQPCPKRKGATFRSFIHQLQEKGYAVETRELRACDYGAPTIRKRLFMIARCDGQPIMWPEPTHGAPTSPGVLSGALKPWRTAAECIDWSLACPSIFERKRELAEATMKRIARGIKRYVIESGNPFIVSCNHMSNKTVYDCFRGQPIDEPVKTITASHGMGIVAPHITKFRTGSTGIDLREPMPTITAGPKVNPAGAAHALGLVAPFLTEHANGSTQRNFDASEPLRTQCAEVKGGHFAVVAPTLIQSGYGEREGQSPRLLDLGAPVGTVVAGGVKHALIGAFLAKHYGNDGAGSAIDAPAHTVTSKTHQAIAASTLIKLRNNQYAQDIREPAPTLTSGGNHVAEVRAFLIKYYSEGGQDQSCADPMHTIPCHDRIGLVTVAGEQYVIADIGMRMLEPHELYAAQGFPSTYIIAPTVNGRRLPKHAQVRMCGNSVSPPLAAALARANVPELAAWTPKEAKAQKVAA